MEIKKISEKYNFYQEGANYVLDLGGIKNGEDTTTELNVSGFENPNLLTFHPVCGCTSSSKTVLEDLSVSIKLKYNNCDPSFAKVVEIKYDNKKVGIIKIKGTCR